MKRPTLPLHEWCIIVLFCLILLALASFPYRTSKSSSEEITPIAPPEFLISQVKITGEVAHPGVYELATTPTLKDLLKQAQPLPTADLSCINSRKKLRSGQNLHIAKKRIIKIRITGAVEKPGELEIQSGTRLCDLADELPVLPEADLKSLRKKKSFVQEGDCLEVPSKRKKGEKPKKKKKILAFLLWKNKTIC